MGPASVAVAAPDRRARALRARRRPCARCRASCAGDGDHCWRGGPSSRTGLGQRRYSRAQTVHRPCIRFGHAPGLGTRRVSQVVPVTVRRPHLRSAASDGRALPRPADDVGPHRLAIQQQGARDAAEQNTACGDTRAGRRPLERGRMAYRARHLDAGHDTWRPRVRPRHQGPAPWRSRASHVLLARSRPMGRDRLRHLASNDFAVAGRRKPVRAPWP